jgi:hypothetical protein
LSPQSALEKNNKYSNIIVLTTNREIENFLSSTGILVKYIDLPLCRLRNIGGYLNIKRLLKTHVGKINKGSDLYFCHNAYDVSGFYLVKLWRSIVCGDIYYCDMDPVRVKYGKILILKPSHLKKYIYCLVQIALLKIFWRLSKIEMLSDPCPVLGIDSLFINYYSIKKFEECCPEKIREYIPRISFAGDTRKVLYLTDNDKEFENYILTIISK